VKFAKKLKEVMPERNLRYLLHEHLAGFDPSRGVKIVHASELTRPEGFCPRFYALADVTKAKLRSRWLTTSEQVTFDIGRYLQDRVIEWFAEMNKAVAHWRCLACARLHEFQTRPLRCQACGVRTFRPEELRFTSAVTGASCGIDMLLAVGEPRLTSVEIKTIDKEQFKGLVAPLAEHRLRTNLYLRIIAESEHPWSNLIDADRAIVLYVSKGGYGCAAPELKQWGLKEGFSPFKDFVVLRDDTRTETQARRAKVVKDFRAGLVGMPCGICATAMVKRAQQCELRKACFSGDHPPDYDWQEDQDALAGD
jgi:DNA-directed RNA polymerase subunit RPC12/RpoP